ncbi:MAG: CPCC family cysteine-rich protein [Acidimicrobiales bacterium]
MCFWQDDIVQLRWPDFAGGANRSSLEMSAARGLL